MARRFTPDIPFPGPGNLKTPLEGVDLVADGINRAASIVPEVLESVAGAAGKTLSNLKTDIASPRTQPERPIPPDHIIKPVFSGLGHIVEGVIDTVKSGVDSVVNNVEGARQELETFVKG